MSASLRYQLIAGLVFVAGLSLTVLFWRFEENYQDERLREENHLSAARLGNIFSEGFSQLEWLADLARTKIHEDSPGSAVNYEPLFQSATRGMLGKSLQSIRFVRLMDTGEVEIIASVPHKIDDQNRGTPFNTDNDLWQAALLARDKGQTVFTHPQSDEQGDDGFGSSHLVAPVYNTMAVPDGVDQKRQALEGWVIIGLEIEPLVRLSADLAKPKGYAKLVLVDPSGAKSTLVDTSPRGFDHYRHADGWGELSETGVSLSPALSAMGLGMVIFQDPLLEPSGQQKSSTIVQVLGGLLSILLPVILLILSQGPARAEAIARRMTETARQNEERARDAEHRLQDAIESMSEGFALWSPDDRLVVFNEQYRAIYSRISDLIVTGVSFDVLARAAIERGQHMLGHESLEDWITKRVALHRAAGPTYEQRLSDGRWILAKEHKTRDGGILAIRTDITEPKQQEHALLDSERRFRDLVECSSDWVWEMDADITYTYVSPKIQDILGYEAEDIIGSTPFYLMPPGEARRMRMAFQTLMEDRLPFADLQNTALHKDGRPVEMETSGVPVFSPEGLFIGYRGVARDITQRKQDENILRESETRFRQISETVPVAVVISKTKEKTIVYVNDTGADWVGVNASAIVGERISDIFWTEADHNRLMEVMRVDGHVENMEMETRNKLNEPLWLLVSAQPIQYEGEHAILSASVDVTANKMAQANLIQTSKMATLGEMATGVAHELNQPLAIIRMAVESAQKALTRKDQLTPEDLTQIIQEKFDRIDRQVTRATAITDHMRILGRKSSGEKQMLDIIGSLKGVIDLMQGQLAAQNIELTLDVSQAVRPFIIGDQIRLEQVFLNLFSNARDAIIAHHEADDADARRIDVRVKEDPADKKVSIFIQDSGGGIDEAILDRIFEPFFTTKDVGKGTGLGLSISFSIIMEHNGTITVQNVVGGAEFVITLDTCARLGACGPTTPD